MEVKVTWKPYQIDPSTKEDGEPMEAYCRRRWGGSGWTHHLKSEGRKDGAKFNNWKWWPNTMKGHQLVHFASENCGVDTNQANAVLFRAMYEEGKNIALVSTLVDIGVQELNVPNRDQLKHYLENDLGADDVSRQISSSQRRYSISGVPFFVISSKETRQQPYGLSGAQSSSTFLNVFEQIVSQAQEQE